MSGLLVLQRMSEWGGGASPISLDLHFPRNKTCPSRVGVVQRLSHWRVEAGGPHRQVTSALGISDNPCCLHLMVP